MMRGARISLSPPNPKRTTLSSFAPPLPCLCQLVCKPVESPRAEANHSAAAASDSAPQPGRAEGRGGLG